MAEHTTEKCAHPACACKGSRDSKFCSTFCEGATENPDITCSCGHACCRTHESVELLEV
jgi:hypothetical protein